MSLGPPFDDSGERLQLGVGAATGAVLLFATVFALLAAERPLGDSISVHVLASRPGALNTGAPLRVAGQPIGEVVAIRGQPLRSGTDAAPAVDIEVRLQKQFRDRVYRNSTIITVNPTVLTEALLEVGPPAGGVAPEHPVEDGDRLRGSDPADIDQLLLKLYLSMESLLAQTRDLRLEWTEFRRSTGALSTRIAQSLPADELLRAGLNAAAVRQTAAQLAKKLRDIDLDQNTASLRLLSKSVGPLVQELDRLAQAFALLQNRANAIAGALGPRQPELLRTIAGLRKSIALENQAERDLDWLLHGFQNGRGTLGGFNSDIQLFDELKEIHRILKHQSWRMLIKRPDPGQRNLR